MNDSREVEHGGFTLPRSIVLHITTKYILSHPFAAWSSFPGLGFTSIEDDYKCFENRYLGIGTRLKTSQGSRGFFTSSQALCMILEK